MLHQCDFCGRSNPKFKFRNQARKATPEYFSACVDCAILVEDGDLRELVRRNMCWMRTDLMGAITVAHELAVTYAQISRRRETF